MLARRISSADEESLSRAVQKSVKLAIIILAIREYERNTRCRGSPASVSEESSSLVRRKERRYESRFGDTDNTRAMQPHLGSRAREGDRNLWRSTLFLSKLTSLEHQRCLGEAAEMVAVAAETRDQNKKKMKEEILRLGGRTRWKRAQTAK